MQRATDRLGDLVGRLDGVVGDVDDAAVLSSVTGRLAADNEVDAHQIDVDVKDGVVTLSGRVDSTYEAARATRIAAGTSGVQEVISRLQY